MVERGLADSREGHVIPNEEMSRRVEEWPKREELAPKSPWGLIKLSCRYSDPFSLVRDYENGS